MNRIAKAVVATGLGIALALSVSPAHAAPKDSTKVELSGAKLTGAKLT